MIYFVRHGLDDESYIGGYSTVNLTMEGIRQAEESALWLKDSGLEFNRIYSSDIKRAVSTAEIINKYFDLSITKDCQLRELDKGEMNGLKKEIAMEKYPEFMNVDDIYMRYPSGESMYDLYCRIKVLLSNISRYDKSLIVTHRGVINMMYIMFSGDDLNMDKEKYGVEHASIHELDLVKSRIRRIR